MHSMTEKGHSPNTIVVRGGDFSSAVPETFMADFSEENSSQGQAAGCSLLRLRSCRQRKTVSTKELLDMVQAALDLIAEDETP